MHPEILAPAGNINALKSAITHGADAVYFGVSTFNARIMADNFTTDNLSEWVDYCHFFGVKAYLALNTMIKESEIRDLIEVVKIATRSNVDAFIVADLATVEICKSIAPNIPFHLSTQFGIHNLEGAIFAKKIGAKRIILSRETPISEIKRIKTLDIEIEVFVHGALCVSFSGNCYLSSFIDGHSGNRGRCKQPCRKKYLSSISKKEGYYLSTNDLCFAHYIKNLNHLGVDSFKIEGRLKSAEYVSATLKAYKNALRNCLTSADIDEIKANFARTFSEKGYLEGSNDNIINPELQNNAGLKVGVVKNVETLKNGLKKIVFDSNRALEVDDGVKFLRYGVEMGGATLTSCGDKRVYEVYLKADVKVGDEVRLTKTKLQEFNPSVSVDVIFEENVAGQYLLTMRARDVEYIVNFTPNCTKIAQKDQTSGLINVLRKGNSPFVINNVDVKLRSDALIPFSQLNSARKTCLEGLKARLIKFYDKGEPQSFEKCITNTANSDRKIAVIVSSNDGLKSVVGRVDDIIYMPYNYEDTDDFFKKVGELSIKVYFAIPTVCFEKDLKVLYKTIEKHNTLLAGVYGNGAFCLEIAKKYKMQLFRGQGANIANNISIKTGDKVVLSPELNKEEISLLDKNAYVYAFGYLPLMTFVHCPNKSNGKYCDECTFLGENSIYYSDKYDKFTIKRIKVSSCQFELYPDKPISLLDKRDEFCQNLLLDLRCFSGVEIKKIFDRGIRYDDICFNKYYQRGVL